MRGTGSHDVVIEDVCVPQTTVAMRRPAGEWVAGFQLMQMMALPLVLGCYLGAGMRDQAISMAAKCADNPGLIDIVGELDTDLNCARVTHSDMVQAATTQDPSAEALNRIFMARTIVGAAFLRVAGRAMEAAGGSAFYRAAGLERLFRDIQGVRYHKA